MTVKNQTCHICSYHESQLDKVWCSYCEGKSSVVYNTVLALEKTENELHMLISFLRSIQVNSDQLVICANEIMKYCKNLKESPLYKVFMSANYHIQVDL